MTVKRHANGYWTIYANNVPVLSFTSLKRALKAMRP
jgi:hypothetical protein